MIDKKNVKAGGDDEKGRLLKFRQQQAGRGHLLLHVVLFGESETRIKTLKSGGAGVETERAYKDFEQATFMGSTLPVAISLFYSLSQLLDWILGREWQRTGPLAAWRGVAAGRVLGSEVRKVTGEVGEVRMMTRPMRCVRAAHDAGGRGAALLSSAEILQ